MNSSLNDAATFLMQLEPTDISELSLLQEMLISIDKNNPEAPEAFRDKILHAVQTIGEIIDETAPDPDIAFTDVGKWIESAMDALEESIKTEPEITDVLDEDEDVSETTMAEDAESITTYAEPVETERLISPSPPKTEVPSAEDSTPATDDEPPVPLYLPENSDPELIGAFITESIDLIANAEDALLTLEQNPDDMDAVSIVFRAFHTIKGTSAFLELSLISDLAHRAESLLSRIRDRDIRYVGGYTDLALRSVDMLKSLIEVTHTAMEGEAFYKPSDYDELMHHLSDPEAAGISDESAEEAADFTEPAEPTEPIESVESDERTDELTEPIDSPEPETFEPDISYEDKESEESDYAEEEAEEYTRISFEQSATADPLSFPEELDSPVISPPKAPQPPRMSSSRKGVRQGTKQMVESSVRVPIERLDRFIDMVGELVVAHSMVSQDEVVASGTHHELLKKVTHTGKIVRELQSMSMSMRMIPLRATFQKMARLVRDLARKAGKKVTFTTEGEDTEIDRNMVDIINDPLVHMIRNAVDHGIEMPDVREKNGKSPTGIVQISACHSAGNVVVEIKDDGRGIDRDAVLAKALEKELITPSDMDKFSDREISNLIFKPGFSTAEKISDISGRGVGMDVVKTNIEALRGQIEVQSEPGIGTTLKISLPLTLAIIDGMVLRVGCEKYVMPTVSIIRSVRPNRKDISKVLNKGEMLLLQGKLIPLFRLANLFEVEDAEQDPTRAIVMVVEDDSRQAGLVIDELIGTQQIVIKTLGEALRDIPGISGSAIMPNGRVGLILDVGGLVRLANKA